MTKPSEELIHLVHEINKELLMGESGWRMDKCAAMIEEYAKADRAAIVEECKAAILKDLREEIERLRDNSPRWGDYEIGYQRAMTNVLATIDAAIKAEDDERGIEPGDAVAYIGFDGDPFIHRWPKGISCPPRKCGYVVLMRAAEVRRKLEARE